MQDNTEIHGLFYGQPSSGVLVELVEHVKLEAAQRLSIHGVEVDEIENVIPDIVVHLFVDLKRPSPLFENSLLESADIAPILIVPFFRRQPGIF